MQNCIRSSKTEKKEAEIERLSQQATIQTLQLSQQRYLTFGMFALVVLVVGGGGLVYRQRKTQARAYTGELGIGGSQKNA